MGRGRQLRRAGEWPGPGVRPGECRPTGSTSSTSTACGSTPRRPLRHRPGAYPRRDRPADPRGGRGSRGVLVVGENEPQHARLLRGPRSGAASASTCSGATTSTTRRGSPPRGAARGTTATTSARRRSWSRSDQARLALPGAMESPAGEAARDAGTRHPSLGVHPLSSRTTTRSATRRRGERLHELTSPGRSRALTALQLLGPATPMLFQGQEFAASSPFLYFGDQDPDVAEQIHRGRRKFLAQFPSLATPEMQARLPAPGRRETFERRSSTRPSARGAARRGTRCCTRDLLRLRREDPTFRGRASRRRGRRRRARCPRRWSCRWFDPEGQVTTVSLAGQPRRRASSAGAAEPLAGPARGPAVADPLVERGPSLRRPRHRPSPRPRSTTGGWPPTPPWCWPPCPPRKTKPAIRRAQPDGTMHGDSLI